MCLCELLACANADRGLHVWAASYPVCALSFRLPLSPFYLWPPILFSVGVAKHLLLLEGMLTERQLRTAAAAAAAHQHQQGPGTASAAAAAGSRTSSDADSRIDWRPLPSSGSGEEGSATSGALWLPLADSSGDVLGAALCCPRAGQAASNSCSGGGGSARLSNSGSHLTGGGFQRPIYVSAGHRVSLATTLAVVAHCCKHRRATGRWARWWD